MTEEKLLDYRGLKSPDPLFKVREELDKAKPNVKYTVLLTDRQCKEVIPIYIQAMGHKIIEISEEETVSGKVYKIVFITQSSSE